MSETVKQVYAYWHQNRPDTTDPITLASAVLNTARTLRVTLSDVVYAIDEDLSSSMAATARISYHECVQQMMIYGV